MAAVDALDQPFGGTLDGVAARLALPFSGREIGGDFLGGQAFEAHNRFAHPVAQSPVGRAQRDGREHAVTAARHQFEAVACARFLLGLGQDATPDCDHRVASKGMRLVSARSFGLLARHAPGIIARQLALQRRLVDIGRGNARRFDPEPREQFAPARAGRCEDELVRGQIRWGPLIAGPDPDQVRRARA